MPLENGCKMLTVNLPVADWESVKGFAIQVIWDVPQRAMLRSVSIINGNPQRTAPSDASREIAPNASRVLMYVTAREPRLVTVMASGEAL
jgi:hypothetical protein